MEEHLGPLRDQLGVSQVQLMGLGRVEPQNESETFCMTVLALKLSRRANAVSCLHGHISRRMWANLWPWRVEEEIPIGHITNGVHVPSWLAWQMKQLFDKYFPAGWMLRMGEPKVWKDIYKVDPGELWETHLALKNLMLAFARRRLSRQCRRRGEGEDVVEAARNVLDPTVLTIGFARRLRHLQAADLILADLDRFFAMLNDEDRPVQFIFSGKAHPADEPGKKLIKRIANLRHDARAANRVVFIEDYDIKRLSAPDSRRRCLAEQPPTSAGSERHQRAKSRSQRRSQLQRARWLVGRGLRRQKRLCHWQRRSPRLGRDQLSPRRRGLYEVLENSLIPLYYDRDVDGLPRQWIRMMMNSIASLAWRFSPIAW